MTLKTKMSVILSSVFIVIFILVVYLVDTRIFKLFYTIENKYLSSQAETIIKAVNVQGKQYSGFAKDWGAWDETYNFMKNSNNDYINKNLVSSTLTTLDTYGIYFFDTDFRIHYSYTLKQRENLSNRLIKDISDNAENLKNIDFTKKNYIIINIKGHVYPFFASIQAVTPTNADKSPNGYFVIGKFLDKDFFMPLEDSTGLGITPKPLCKINDTNKKSKNNTFFIDYPNNDYADITTYYKDFTGKTTFCTITTVSRDFNKLMNTVFKESIFFLLILGFLIISITIFIIDRLILSKISQKIKTFKYITESGDISKRMKLGGAKEINELALAANETFETVELLHKQLKEYSMVDGLTKIPNRRFFEEYIDNEWARCLRDNDNISLLFIDIDYFKQYNDNYGHLAGDEALVRIASTIKNSLLRPADIVARYGGEEFIVLLPKTGFDGADYIAKRIIEGVSELHIEHIYSQVSKKLTVSIGAATILPTAFNSKDTLIKAADEAMYKVKNTGRNNVLHAE